MYKECAIVNMEAVLGMGWQQCACHIIKALIIRLSTNIHFSNLGLCSCVREAERSPINAHWRILNVLCIHTET